MAQAIGTLQSRPRTSAWRTWGAAVLRVLFGERPRMVLLFAAPTLMAVTMDVLLRARALAAFPPFQWLNYTGSSLASAGFWSGPLWLASRLFLKKTPAARAGLAAFSLTFVAPLAFLCFGGQALYFLVFRSYMARDTVRLGIALRGTLGAWLASWGASVLGMAAIGLLTSAAILVLARKAAHPVRTAWPVVPLLSFGAATYCFWIDFVESRSLQAAPPDTCFIHGLVHAVHDGVLGKGWARRGISLREPDPLPPIARPAHRPNVLLIVSESVRADVWCSSPPGTEGGCKAEFLDAVAPDRIALGRLTMQSSGTFTSCVLLWTGLGPDADFRTLHHAPVLWEMARAIGYRTGYIGSQNLRYDDFGSYLRNAGIDVIVSAADLGDAADPHIGAPDENATARLLQFVKDAPEGTPYFAVLHLSNTHWPYRVDPALQPNAPHDESPLAPVSDLFSHYKNSVLLQERTVSAMLKELRALPSFKDTAVLFVSDHGEEFRDHGRLYHLSSVFDDQIRVPAWLVAGDLVLAPEQKDALRGYATRRTYTRDVHMTVVDLLGLDDARRGLPFGDLALGRSLLRPPPPGEPIVPIANRSGVWEPDEVHVGVLQGEMLGESDGDSHWRCFDAEADPSEHDTVDLKRCEAEIRLGAQRFGMKLPEELGANP